MTKKHRRRPPAPRKVAKHIKTRAGIVLIIILCLLILLVVRIWFITRDHGEQYNMKVLSQMNYKSEAIKADRGQILDRNGTCLAYNVNYYTLIVEPKNILYDEKGEDLERTARTIAKVFNLNYKKVVKEIRKSKRPYYTVLKTGVSEEERETFLAYDKEYTLRRQIRSATKSKRLKKAAELQAQLDAIEDKLISEDDDLVGKIIGISLDSTPRRYYPYGSFASNVIGFANNNGGVTGLEKSYDKILSGTDGRTYGYLNQNSSVDVQSIPEQDGYTIVSTIDSYIQKVCERELRKYESRIGSNVSAIMVMDPNNAEVLAMATSKTYDLNTDRTVTDEDVYKLYPKKEYDAMTPQKQAEARSEAALLKWQNFCVSGSYEPGSVAKSFTVAAALEEDTASEDSYYYCNGVGTYAGSQIHCHLRSGHGPVSLKGSLMASCNDALMQIGVKLGAENFCKYQQLFGLGQLTGIDLPDEQSCVNQLYTEDNMDIVSLATNSFGQNFCLTMTQMCAGYCALVNGGYYYQPHVVKQIRDSEGNVIENVEPVLVRQAISHSTSEYIKDALFQTVENGTGNPVKIEGYEIGGKTGTAEKIVKGTRKKEIYTISFMATAPAFDPEVIVYVVVDEPNCSKAENSVQAKPIAKKVLEEILPYLNIYPSSDDDVSKSDGDYTDSKYEENDDGNVTAGQLRDAADEVLEEYNNN